MTKSSSSEAVIARVLLPDDANPAGNVHGGTILRLMEEAGYVSCQRFLVANRHENDATCVAAMVRFENMSFHQPMFVGEMASLLAHVVFTSPHSVLVKVIVTAENLDKGKTRVTNTGELWYVPLVAGENKDWKKPVVVEAPQLVVPTDGGALQEYNSAKQSYEARKKQENGKQDNEDSVSATECQTLAEFKSSYKQGNRTPAESEQTLCQVVLPSDCGSGGVAFGGFVMKLMDNAAGCSAFRHCRTNVVTVAISAIDFVSWIRLGDLCTIRSKVVFCSSKTLEIEIVASVASIQSLGKEDTPVAKGRFIFVSLGKQGKSIPVPPLKLETEENYENAFLGQQRYEAAKRARAKAAASKS
jgi:acyl-coenzyme A thioesterase 7